MKLLLFQNPMLASENFPHFYYTSTIQTQCWFLKLLSHLWPTTTLLWPFNPYPYPYTSRFGLHWNPRKQFCLPLQKYMWCRPTSLFILFHRRCLPASEPSQFISLFTIAWALHWETTSVKIKLWPNPISSYILISHFPNVGDYLNLCRKIYHLLGLNPARFISNLIS